MKNLSMKTLIIYSIALMGLFGIVRAEEVVTETTIPVVSVTGEFSTDITFGDATTFTSPYSGLVLSGDGWVLSTYLSDGNVNIEEAKYSWTVVEDVLTLTFGSQAEPYGLAWGLHRPSNNWFVSTPRDHSITNGVGIGVNKFGVGANFFYGGSTEDVTDEDGVVTEGSQHWSTRVSYGITLAGLDSKFGLSLNSDEAQLVDVSLGNDLFTTSLEYDLSEAADGAYWLRGVVTPPQAQGAFLLIGYKSDEVVTYGVGYKCSDNMKVMSEFTSGLKDADAHWATRVSYGVTLAGLDSKFGLSLNSDEAQLVDVSLGNSLFTTSLEYDLSEEADGAYWLRGVVTPPQAQGAFLLLGYNSEEVVTYGVGYKCSDNMKVVSEFTSGMKDADGNEVTNDFSIRASYSF